MAADGALSDALSEFADQINRDERLRQMIRDWNRWLRCVALDTGSSAGLRVQDAEVHVVDPPSEEDILLEGAEELLVGMFKGEVSPTEPYLDGRLRVKGSQEDVLRLDFLSLMIWGD